MNRTRIPRLSLTACTAVTATVIAFAPPASAANSPSTLYDNGDNVVIFTAGAGVDNKFSITDTGLPSYVRFQDGSGASVSVPASSDACEPAGVLPYAFCVIPSNEARIIIDARDGNDHIYANTDTEVVLAGNAGNDVLRSLGRGRSTFMGGSGDDTVTFAAATAPVIASLDGVANDRISGYSVGEIYPDVEGLVGGSGNDTLRGGGAKALGLVQGGPGNDTLYGGPPGSGLLGDAGSDRLVAVSGTNFLNGGPGSDELVGGPGADWLWDNDGSRDYITCGGGDDDVSADQLDVIRDPQNCESISRG